MTFTDEQIEKAAKAAFFARYPRETHPSAWDFISDKDRARWRSAARAALEAVMPEWGPLAWHPRIFSRARYFISHPAPEPDTSAEWAKHALATWDRWLEGDAGSKDAAYTLLVAASFAAAAYEDEPDADKAGGDLLRAFLVALIDPASPDLDRYRAGSRKPAPEQGELERLREAHNVAVEIAETIYHNPAGSLWNYGTTPTAKDRAEWKGAKETALEILQYLDPERARAALAEGGGE